MRLAVTTGPERMEVVDGPPPAAAPGMCLVDVEAVGLCGSDFHLFDGTHPYARFPQTQGHEVVGRIASLPPDYSGDLQVGQRVAVEPLISCGHCFACRRGRPNCCTSLQVMGVHVGGGLAETISAGPDRLFPVGDLPPLVAVLTEPMSIGMQAVVRGQVTAADDVVVIGAGPIGLAAALCAWDRGARVLVADRIAGRLRTARDLGAERTVDTSAEDLAGAVADFTGSDGAAVVVEATGVPALLRQAVDLVAPSGTIVVVGISTEEVAIPVSEFSRKEITVAGSRNNAGVFAAAADLVARHAERLAPMVTHTFGLDEAPRAIDFARRNPAKVEKVVIEVAR